MFCSKNKNGPAPPARLPSLCIFKMAQLIPYSRGLSKSLISHLIGPCGVLPDDLRCHKSWACFNFQLTSCQFLSSAIWLMFYAQSPAINATWMEVMMFISSWRQVSLQLCGHSGGFSLPCGWMVLFDVTKLVLFLSPQVYTASNGTTTGKTFKVHLQLWDTAGQERWAAPRPTGTGSLFSPVALVYLYTFLLTESIFPKLTQSWWPNVKIK